MESSMQRGRTSSGSKSGSESESESESVNPKKLCSGASKKSSGANSTCSGSTTNSNTTTNHRHLNKKSNGGIMTTSDNTMDARSWFESLPSGEDRAASMVVSDPAFAGMFVSMVCNGSCSSSAHGEISTDCNERMPLSLLSCETKQVKDIAKAYKIHSGAQLNSNLNSSNTDTPPAQLQSSSESSSTQGIQPKATLAENTNGTETRPLKNLDVQEGRQEERDTGNDGSDDDKNNSIDADRPLTASTSDQDAITNLMNFEDMGNSSSNSSNIVYGENVPVKEIVSTAFRIKPSEVTTSTNTNTSVDVSASTSTDTRNAAGPTETTTTTTTTSLTTSVSATSSSTGEEKDETRSRVGQEATLNINNSNNSSTKKPAGIITLSKASIANRNRSINSTKGQSLTLSAPKFPQNFDMTDRTKTNLNERGDDVDRGIHFSALSCTTSTLNNLTKSTTKNPINSTVPQAHGQEESRTKRDGSLVLSPSSSSLRIHTKRDNTLSKAHSSTFITGGNILQHVCLVFTSALGMMTQKYKNTISNNSSSNNHNNNDSNNNSSSSSSSSSSNIQSKTNSDNSNVKNYEKIELLTVDPLYLNKHSQNGLDFLHDADRTIDDELKKLGVVPRDESFVPRFLTGTPRLQDDSFSQTSISSSSGQGALKPWWFDHFTESDDTSIPAALVLLARIERSIRESHEQHSKGLINKSESKDPHEVKFATTTAVSRENFNLVTPPPSPRGGKDEVAKNDHLKGNPSEGDGTLDNFLTPKEVEVDEKDFCKEEEMTAQSAQCIKRDNVTLDFMVPMEGQTSKQDAGRFVTEFLGSWNQLKEKSSSEDTIKNMKDLFRSEVKKTPNQWHRDAEKALESFRLKDLLLVPICSVLLIRPPPSKLGVNQTKAYIELLVSEWSRIISAALTKVKNDIAADDLLSDPVLDSAVAKPGTGKKKKKKNKRNKKKKRKATVTTNVDSFDEQKHNFLATVPSNETAKRNNEEGNKLNSIVNNDCTLSVVSSVSVATEASKKISMSDNASVQPILTNGEVAKPSTNIPVSKVNNTNSACVGGARAEESDNQSSDGWETVPKGGRSRRLTNLASKNNEKQVNELSVVPQSPNSGRRNKGKAKSRQRTKQKAKEKEPNRITESLEEGIAKRGTNTIKALMEERNKRPTEEMKKNVELSKQISARSSVADQNTAQTIPESLSGVSTAPVQTLVGPGNNNSASSSVASSLEAPHATRHKPRQHHDSCREDDVGYHLLKVCERLSSDMNTFMRRRSAALEVRRSERGALLAALQDTVQTIWAGQCHVEMYGSCATQLDLPSSDLDVVIRGLDGSENPYMSQNGSNKSFERERSSSVEVNANSFDGQEHNSPQPPSSSPNLSTRPYLNYSQNFYQPLSANGNRVLRLAAELERQPWAVQVKAIPTASVPVIKILSDASRLPGAEWMVHHQQRAVAAAEMKMVGGMSHNPPNTYHNAKLQWRGADVMNDLLSLDITFEGPEHGGVGSTAYSAQVVQSVVSESGLPPDSTPAVQLLMVIKELLAQRRLNEPFSGGLSSYAILLLVVAVLKERHIIREEIERVERQQRAVSSESTTVKAEKKATLVKKSSWAAIAKKTSVSQNCPEVQNRTTGTDNKDIKNNVIPKKPTSVQESAQEDNTKSANEDQSIAAQDSTLFPQGSNDVLEVLCSGEPTAGKLLMHFLLFYGRHFDARTTCIDVSGTHHPDSARIKNDSKRNWSSFINRKPGGTYNPHTDMYTVEPLVVYDPLEGGESYNVTRSCYAWPTISWTFDQCFNTLSGVVELGSETNGNRGGGEVNNGNEQSRPNGNSLPSFSSSSPQHPNTTSNGIDNSSRNVDNDGSLLLELLLSF